MLVLTETTEQILLGIGKDLDKERDRLKKVKQSLDKLVVDHSIFVIQVADRPKQ